MLNKEQDFKYFRLFKTYSVIATPHLCPCSVKAAKDNMQINRHGYVPIRLYYKDSSLGMVFRMCSLLTTGIEE